MTSHDHAGSPLNDRGPEHRTLNDMTAPLEADIASWAKSIATRYIDAPQFRAARWPHVQAVAAKAAALAPAYNEEGNVLIAAAWLHDVGYAPELAETGFHPLDGGRFIAKLGADRIAGLVAHHSGAALEAELRGLSDALAVFVDEVSPLRDALWACDMTTSPTGHPISFEERRKEIEKRYGLDHTVPQAINGSAEKIRAAIARTNEIVGLSGLTVELLP